MDDDMPNENSRNSDVSNLIINYLPESMEQSDLHQMFSSFGDIESCRLIRDKVKRVSLGYGFVKFSRLEDAQAAINNLDGLTLQHKKIKVSFARPANETAKTANVYVSGLKNTVNEAEIISIFSVYGKVLTVTLKNNDGDARKCNAIGFVRFENLECAQEAITTLNETKPLNNPSPIHVSFAKQAKDTKSNTVSPLMSYDQIFNFTNARLGLGKVASFSKNLRLDPLGKNNQRSPLSENLFTNSDFYNPPPLVGKGYVLFVFNLNPDCEEVKLWRLFGPYGAINEVKIMVNKDTNECKGFAFVTMANRHEAETAIRNLNNKVFEDKVLQVSFKREKKN